MLSSRLVSWTACAVSLAVGPATLAQQNGSVPVIQWLTATPSSIPGGASTTLRWHVDGAATLSVDQGVGAVPAIGTAVVAPVSTTTYTLSATNANGSAQLSHVVTVGPNPTASGGRYVNMVSPVSGQTFTAPATLRVFAAAQDPNVLDGCGATGTGFGCASRVDFYVDGTLKAQVPAAQSEYWVFKATFGDVGPGLHRVWARAVYVNPPATLDSESMWITVAAAPAYAQTVDLTQDVVLSGAQDYTLIGSAGGRIRLNGNGHRIRSEAGWSGRLRLRHVDVFGLGVLNDPTPAIDVATSAAVEIENSTFDTSGTVALDLSSIAPATIRGNTFRSNMWMPAAQQPEYGPDASYPAFSATGSSTAPKRFQGNSIGLGWADFRNARHWLIGGEAEADGNVVIAPRGGIWAQNLAGSTIRGNLVYHVYFGGWSQGNVMELSGSDDVVIEHNVIGGGSWPIRSLGGTLRYNLVLDAGHQWLWVTGDGADVHHNVFVGGDSDIAGIWAIYGPQNVKISNNTLDGLGRASVIRPVWVGEDATLQLRANAIVNMRNPPGVQIDGLLDADYNLFWGQQGTPLNYSDNRVPAHDVGPLNAQVDPRFLEAPEPLRYRWEDLWTRRIQVREVLANYRTRYTPASDSPLRDAGDPGSAQGNDIGAVGSGVPAADDRFGLSAPVKGDLDGDARTDLLFRRTATGQNDVWVMDGVLRSSLQTLAQSPASVDWRIVGADDFDADLKTDLVFWNGVTGAVEFWLMNGTSRIGAPIPLAGAPTLATHWRLSATGDFDHDGQPDLVWRDVSSQKIEIWKMAGTTRIAVIVPSPDQAVHANWEIVAALDYDGDGHRDLLWYNSSSGNIVQWLMNASVVRTSGRFTNPPGAGDFNWKVLAGGDYGSGTGGATSTNDIVWRNATSGNVVVWYMDLAGSRTSGTFTTPMAPTPDPTGWTIVGPR